MERTRRVKKMPSAEHVVTLIRRHATVCGIAGQPSPPIHFLAYNVTMPYLIPPIYISILAILGLFLCLFSFRKAEHMTRSSLVGMLKLGSVLIGSSLFLIGALYFYYSIGEIEITLRSTFLRWALSYLLLSINIWQVILLRFGKNL